MICLNLYTKSPEIKIQKDLADRVLLIWHYIWTLSQNAAGKIFKMSFEVYDIYILVLEVLLSKLYNEH